MTNFAVKNNELYQNFLNQKTIFGLKAAQNSQAVENYFNWLQESFPNLDKQRLTKELQEKFANLDVSLGMKNILRDKEAVEKVKKEIYSQLDQLLLGKNSFFNIKPETIELLKEKIAYGLAFQRVDNLAFWFKFYYQELFLNQLPNELRKELNREPKLEIYEINGEQKQSWDFWSNELLKRTVDYFSDLESEPDLQTVNRETEDIYTELAKVINWSREDTESARRYHLVKTNGSLSSKLKDIPANQWDKIKITNPWLHVFDHDSLLHKIVKSRALIAITDDGSAQVTFTRPGLDKIKAFVDNEWIFPTAREGGKVPLKSLSTSQDILWDINGVNGYDNLGQALEAGQILKQGEFISREAFDFMVWTMGDKEVEYKKSAIQGESGLSPANERPEITPTQTELKNIDPANWSRIEVSWGDGTMTDWLKKLAAAIRQTNNLVNDRRGNFAVFDFPSNKPGVSEVRDYVRMDWELVPGVKFPAQGSNPDIRFANLDLPAPFNYKTQNVHENVAHLVWGSPTGGKIFYGQKNKVGTFKSRQALEYLQKIAGELEVKYEGLSLVDEEEILTPPVLGAKAPYVINNPVSTRVNLAYHLKVMSRAERETLKGRLAILESDQNYWKQIKNIDPRHWGIIQFVNDKLPFSLDHGGQALMIDYRNWLSKQNRPDWELPSDNYGAFFRNGFSNSSYLRPLNEGVIHYLKEKYGEQEIRVFYARNPANHNQSRCLEWFVDEFLNDEKAYMNNVTPFNALSPTAGFWINLSSGSGDLINVRALPKSKREELKDRRVIIWDNVTDYRKLYKDIKTDNLAGIRIPLHGFDELVTKVKAADEEKTKMGRANERLLTADNRFASQALLDEWKQLVNRTGWFTTPVGGSRTPLGNLTTNDRLQGGEVSGTWNVTGKGNTYRTTDAYEFIIATLLNISNNWFRNNQGNYNPPGLDFLKKMVKPTDWENLQASVDYRRFHRLLMEEFVNDNMAQDIWAFLIDEDRVIGSTTTGTGSANINSQITNLTQQVTNLQTQMDTLLELMTGVPATEETLELQANIQQASLPPFNN